MIDIRVGHGYDVHRLEAGDGVVLGGVRVACEYAMVAHSDGDVMLHALCDALLGAAGLGDIGEHFPDSDPSYRGADSRTLLRTVVEQLSGRGWRVVNADLTLVAQVPRVSAHKLQMRQIVADDLGVEVSAVNIKATTPEYLGPIGRAEGVAAHAVVLIAVQ